MEDLRRVLRVLKLCSWSPCPYKSPCTNRVRRFLLVTLFPRIWFLRIFLSPHLSTFGFWVPHKFPCTSMITLSFIDVHPDWLDVPHPAEAFPWHSTGCVTRNWWVSPLPESLASVSPSVNLHWKSLLDLSLTLLSSFRSDQKENCWKDCKRTSRNSSCWMNEEGGSHVTRETLFGWRVSKLVFGVNIFYLYLWFQVDAVEQPTKRNSVGSGHVSHRWTLSFGNHLDDRFVVFKNVQLRLALRRMSVCGYVIHIWHMFNIAFALFGWCFVCFFWWHGLLSRTSFLGLVYLVLQCCLLNVTLQLPHPKGHEHVM